jgi:hypothetical protein
MKPSTELHVWKNGRPVTCSPIPSTPGAVPAGLLPSTVIPKDFRRLKWNEVVSRGDFVVDDSRALTIWEGPAGFRAGSFIKLIYRRIKGRPVTIKGCA